jgi:hypothetical protein
VDDSHGNQPHGSVVEIERKIMRKHRSRLGISATVILMTAGVGGLAGAGTAGATTYADFDCQYVTAWDSGGILQQWVTGDTCTGPVDYTGPGVITGTAPSTPVSYWCQHVQSTIYPEGSLHVSGLGCS